MSFGVGYRHVDTSEVYPNFEEVGISIRALPRSQIFLTSKVDPTRTSGRPAGARRNPVCSPSGDGCFASTFQAANATVRRLGTSHIDLLLLHRPPKREGDAQAQCARLRESWRALEAAQARGLARSIGLSNCCASLLRCLKSSVRTAPAVLQYMQHVGMGVDPFGYRAWAARTWGAVTMAYSVLGGVEGDFGRITGSPVVRRVAKAHETGGANVALSWVAQLGQPLIVLSGNAAHLRDDLQLFHAPPWGKLSIAEMATLSALRSPPGRPSHWGDCRDTLLESMLE
jgi:diketogulonate reductase-like aldo/keto reductase